MGSLTLIEETDDCLVYRSGVLNMLGQMALLAFVSLAASTSLTVFLRHYIGIYAYLCIALPGLICVVCALLGCANARPFTFCFDRSRRIFCAAASGMRLERPLWEVVLVHVEREMGGTSSAPAYAVALLFSDGKRFRLEAGVAASGHGRGPDSLHEQAEKIREFLRLPQLGVPILDVTNVPVEKMGEAEAEASLTRWVTCQGLEPRYSPPLYEYRWIEAPRGAVMLPVPRPAPPQGSGHAGGAPAAAHLHMFASPQLGHTPTVVGRAMTHPQPLRQLQVVIPQGFRGDSLTVQAPDGTHVSVQVPSDLTPGEAITVQY